MKRFVYIISPSYSGSTLLTILLARHREIATIGELKATAMGDLDQYTCSCGVGIRNCPFFTELATRLRDQDIDFTLENFGTHYRAFDHPLIDPFLRTRIRDARFEKLHALITKKVPAIRDRVAATHKRNRAIATATCDIQNRPVFLDGSKEPSRLRYLLQADLPDIRVIHLVRDGRAVTNSALGHEYESLEVAAADWRDTHLEAQRIRALLPTSAFKRLHYEDLCRDPRKNVAELCRFLSLDPDQIDWDAPPTDFHILGNKMRQRPLDEIRLDERWKTNLRENHLRRFGRIAGALNREFNYV